MKQLKVKICGLSHPDHVAAALAGGATHLGMIFFARSPRNVTPRQAAALVEPVANRAETVAVTVDAPDQTLDEIVSHMAPDMLQLHGKETPQRVAQLKTRYSRPVMKAISIREAGDLDAIEDYRDVCDWILLDAKPPMGSDLPGGNGISFDWQLLTRLDPRLVYMLSGGLSLDNVEQALSMARPHGIDISSGVESSPGVKDTAKIKAFLDQVRPFQSNLAV